MVLYYIQPSKDGWYVYRNDEPSARCVVAKQAMGTALLLARRCRQHGESAKYIGILTESIDATAMEGTLDALNDHALVA